MPEHRIFAAPMDQLLTIAVPLLLLTVGCVAIWRELLFGRQAHATWGTVVDLSTRHDGSRAGHLYHPIVQFELESAADPITFMAATGSHPPFWQIGDRVPILYDPGHPQRACINSFTQRWLEPCVLIISALLTLLLLWGLALR